MNIEYPYYKYIEKFNKKKILTDIKNFTPIIYTKVPNELVKYNIEKYDNKYFIIKDIFKDRENINNITDLFSESIRVKCKIGNNISPLEYWNKNKKTILQKYKDIYNIREYIYANTKLCNNFRVTVALTILRYFKPKTWLDISAGWGDRLLAAIFSNVKLYVSTDPNLELHQCYNNIISSLVSKNKQKNFIIHKNGFLEAEISQNDFDIVFSSPPFFDLEKYSDFPEDSLKKYDSEKEWCDNFLVKSLMKAYNLLKVGGHIILYMGGSKYVMEQMHMLDKIMKYKGQIYFYETKPRGIFIWEKIEDKCKIITKTNNNKIILSKENPKLNIISISVNNKKINIIDDSILSAGTKMRVSRLFIKKLLNENKKIDTIVYSGNYNGFGAIATAYAAYKLNINAIVYLGSLEHDKNKIYSSRQISTLLALNAKIYLCNNYRDARDLLWKESTEPNTDIKENIYVLPMGLNDDNCVMVNLLAKQIIKASKNTKILNEKNLRIWLISGSGGIAKSISIAFPNAKLFILPYGGNKYKKKLIDWSKINKNINIIKEESNLDNSLINKYYKSVENYDALIFPYVVKYGLDNDYIWNVAAD